MRVDEREYAVAVAMKPLSVPTKQRFAKHQPQHHPRPEAEHLEHGDLRLAFAHADANDQRCDQRRDRQVGRATAATS